MQYTNLANLPAPLVNAITRDDYDYETSGDISTSSAIEPPRIRQLKKRHKAKIVEDVSEGIWKMIGNIGHKITEHGAGPEHLVEERLRTTVAGWDVTGKVDLLYEDGGYAIDDYKFRSVWAAINAKPEDEAQLNIYALLARLNGFEVKRLRIISVLRDWSKLRAKREPDFPQVGVAVREIPLWPQEKQWDYLESRVLLHQACQDLPDDELPLCTEEERWHKPDTWACIKKGNKKATRVFHSQAEAEAYTVGWPVGIDFKIEHRLGSYPRCESYCAVAKWCSFGKQILAKIEPKLENEPISFSKPYLIP